MEIKRIGHESGLSLDSTEDTKAADTTTSPSVSTAAPSQTETIPTWLKARRRSMKGNLLRDQLQTRLITNKASRVAPAESVGMNTNAVAPVKRSVTFVYDAGDHTELTNLQLKGSWNKTTGQFDPQWGGGDSVPMQPIGNGKWAVTL